MLQNQMCWWLHNSVNVLTPVAFTLCMADFTYVTYISNKAAPKNYRLTLKIRQFPQSKWTHVTATQRSRGPCQQPKPLPTLHLTDHMTTFSHSEKVTSILTSIREG